ncbi:hypothetical protein BJ322DRAFT_1107340 [Thelephora terrestris]|uniref:Uncharacterized protein n=1 Tax=Thelephora terrestris TaxID=56493 RepID=A0A9P6HI79_9AGAM|nr:hypothetical protein BJ322DRAFT_1107340 [Thelephora terrestris]
MATKYKRPKGRDGAISALNLAIDGFSLAKEISSATPAKAVFGSVSILLGMIKDTMANEQDYVDLGLHCAKICETLKRGMDKTKQEDFSKCLCEAIDQLKATVEEIRGKVTKQSGRHPLSRFVRSRNDKDQIAGWWSELNRILQVFHTELAIDTNATASKTEATVSKIDGEVSKLREEIRGQVRPVRDFNFQAIQYLTLQFSTPGELPPPMPRACFGRDDLIKRIVDLAEELHPMALIGAGGIGKTSIALTVLHHVRIKERFGDHRRFIRCDQFPASQTNFLAQLSKVTGAGIETPEDLASLRQYLSSKPMFIVLDNAESILDPPGDGGKEIYDAVEELTQFRNICLCITSRITTIPPDCKRLNIPTLSVEAGCDEFYGIYDLGRSDVVGDILKQLDFHPLSINLLATVAWRNVWNNNRLAREWERRQTGVLQTGHNKSLADTIELSLASPMFKALGPDTRGLLGVIAFFPQGVDENNLDWLFPTIFNRSTILDAFCALSLTYRNEEFVTMLAPLRDYLSPKDPTSSPLLCTVKEHYFTRLSAELDPNLPTFGDTRWIVSEDVNVEHLLNVFTSIDANSDDVWNACRKFLLHLYWHKPRYTVLRQKIEGLPDEHPPKRDCLFHLARLLGEIGNLSEEHRLLTQVLGLRRECGSDDSIANALLSLSDTDRQLGLHKEGIQHAKEALAIFQRLGDTAAQAECQLNLARLLYDNEQYDAAEEAASRAIGLLPEKGEEFQACQSHRVLGRIYRLKGEGAKAIHHLEEALRIATSFKWPDEQSWIHYAMAQLFSGKHQFNDAHAHIEQAKSCAVNDVYLQGRVMEQWADILFEEGKLEEAMSEVLCALEAYKNIGAAKDVENCKDLIWNIEQAKEGQAASDETDSDSHFTYFDTSEHSPSP